MTHPAPIDTDLLQQAIDCLRTGGVVLVPTDTVYGLAVLPSNPDAVDRLYALKARPRAKNLPVMVADAEQLGPLGVEVTKTVRALLDSPYVPGALTLAVGLTNDRANWLAGRDEIAFRIPDDAFLRALMARTGPLLVTSANRSGEATPLTTQAALAQLTAPPDLVIEGRVKGDIPSTLVNCRVDPPVIEREGAIAPQDILNLLG